MWSISNGQAKIQSLVVKIHQSDPRLRHFLGGRFAVRTLPSGPFHKLIIMLKMALSVGHGNVNDRRRDE